MRIGIVGTNFISDTFMQAQQGVEEVTVTAVVSGHKENAVSFANQYQIHHVFDSLSDMLDSQTVDAVYLAVPNSLHAIMSVECVKKHIPVLCEKPFATNAREAKELFQLSHQENSYVQDALVPIYTKNLIHLKNAISRVGKITRAVFCFGRRSSRYDAYCRNENPTTFRKELSNGALMDLGIYCIGDAVALFGKPKNISASATMLETGVDGAAQAILDYGDFSAVIFVSKISNTPCSSFIEGENGTITIDTPSRLSKIWFEDRSSGEKVLIAQDETLSMQYELEEFVKVVKENKIESKVMPHQLTLDILETVDACRHAIGLYYDAD